VFRRRQHRVARDFRTRARRCGDGDERRGWSGQSLTAPDDLQVIQQRALRSSPARRWLWPCVNRTATTEADDDLAILIFGERRAVFDGGNLRFAADGKDHHAQTGVAPGFSTTARPAARRAHHDERARTESFATAPASRRVPAPKMISVAVVNSNLMAGVQASPVVIRRKTIVELHTRARLGHHGGDGFVAPCGVVRGFLVGCLCRRIAINFHQPEARRVVRSAERHRIGEYPLQQTRSGIEQRGRFVKAATKSGFTRI